jgi:hypothetical protein
MCRRFNHTRGVRAKAHKMQQSDFSAEKAEMKAIEFDKKTCTTL